MLLVGGLLALAIGFVGVVRVSSVGGTVSSASVRFTATDRADVTLFLVAIEDGHTYTGVRSLHDAVDVLAVDGLPRHVDSREQPVPVVIHLRVRCELLPSDSVELRLDTDDPPWHQTDLRAHLSTPENDRNSLNVTFACPR